MDAGLVAHLDLGGEIGEYVGNAADDAILRQLRQIRIKVEDVIVLDTICQRPPGQAISDRLE